MKKILTLCFILSFSINLTAQTRKERKAEKKEQLETQYQSIKELIESGSFNFEALRAIPLGNDVANIGLSLPAGSAVFQGGTVNLTGNTNYVNINDGDADIFLPFFGRVFIPKRNPSESGIKYKGEIIKYKTSFNSKKKRIILSFDAKKNNESLKFSFIITPGGHARLTVNSSTRQSISYMGKIKPLPTS